MSKMKSIALASMMAGGMMYPSMGSGAQTNPIFFPKKGNSYYRNKRIRNSHKGK